jgi:hypothetical protein
MATLDSYFDQFLRERTYLNNVTPKTGSLAMLARAIGPIFEG